jgi:hypothetical protein
MMIGSRVGRRLLPSKTRPEPVYQLRWSDPDRYRSAHAPVNATLNVTLRRILPEQSATILNLPPAEYLSITAVEGTYDERAVAVQDLELRLCTLDSDEYWMEACIFHPEFSDKPLSQINHLTNIYARK